MIDARTLLLIGHAWMITAGFRSGWEAAAALMIAAGNLILAWAIRKEGDA